MKKISPKSYYDLGLVHLQSSAEKSVMQMLLCIIELEIAEIWRNSSAGKNIPFLQLYIMYIRFAIKTRKIVESAASV